MNKRLQREIRRYPDRPFSANTLCQLFGELYRRAGIDGASSHSGRRGFITKFAHSGISAKVIVELAGHKHPHARWRMTA